MYLEFDLISSVVYSFGHNDVAFVSGRREVNLS